ncbi:MAG TPA: hypothetical protein EYP04_00085, partial [Anaerolineae bacterium]|nr:hypothetical protein [Anaerolineae bacterium]
YYALIGMGERLSGQAFFWIPDLSFPRYRDGLSWLWPLPPKIGWEAAIAYLVLPVLFIITQVALQRMSTAQQPAGGEQQKAMNQMFMIMPLMFALFTLQVPSGLTLYWVVSNILQIAQQYLVTGWGAQHPAAAGAGTSGGAATPPSGAEREGVTPARVSSASRRKGRRRKKRK